MSSEEKKETSSQVKERIKEMLKDFPQTPGVYLMKNRTEKIIYVGKAKNLKNRVRSYFNKTDSAKTQFLVRHIHNIEYILTKTEVDAFLLEASLIKKHRPRYNVRLKDDKSYPYIKLSMRDQFPRLYLARRVRNDGALYFGPYTSSYAVRGTIRFLNHSFQIRDCKDAVLKTRDRPCMTHQIGHCTAPCVDLVTEKKYSKYINQAVEFLRGNDHKVLGKLEKAMMQEAELERFESAARIRDNISSIERILQSQSVVNMGASQDQDVIGFCGDDRGALVQSLHIRKGREIGSRSHFIPLLDISSNDEDPKDWLVSFINQYYEENFIPDEVILPVELGLDLTKLLVSALEERCQRTVKITYATDANSQKLTGIANEKAKEAFCKHVEKSENKRKGLERIQQRFKLPEFPHRIECYDISNFQGKENVASQVVFEEGVPSKEYYRRYKIKSVEGQNDFASMKEVLSRRLKHDEWPDPQLIVIDGGKGQLNIVARVLKDLDRADIPLVSLAKARTDRDFTETEVSTSDERFFLPGRSNPIIFSKYSEEYRILTSLRDEAHRFAITYHRKLREATQLESRLDLVHGLGPSRKRALLTEFESIEAIKNASVEEISAVSGFSVALAEQVLQSLEGDS